MKTAQDCCHRNSTANMQDFGEVLYRQRSSNTAKVLLLSTAPQQLLESLCETRNEQ